MHFLLGVAAGSRDLALRPLYPATGAATSEIDPRRVAGNEGHGPVRVGNQAAEHVQNDVFGELVLALAPVFLDQRFRAEQTQEVLELLVRLARKGVALAGQPDAGIWEYRTVPRPQTFSSLMAWAGADRMRVVAARHAPALEAEFGEAAARLRAEIVARAFDPRRGAFVGSYGGGELDASLLQMASLRFLPRDDARLTGTLDAIARELDHGGWIRRYRSDGLGPTDVAFVLCTLWYVEALATVGRTREAEAVLARALGALSPLGLLAEDFDPNGARQCSSPIYSPWDSSTPRSPPRRAGTRSSERLSRDAACGILLGLEGSARRAISRAPSCFSSPGKRRGLYP